MPTCSATDESCSSELTSLPLAEEMDTPTCSVAGEGTQLQEGPHTKGMQMQEVPAMKPVNVNTCLKLKVKKQRNISV